jgi:hypothetical protein
MTEAEAEAELEATFRYKRKYHLAKRENKVTATTTGDLQESEYDNNCQEAIFFFK